MRSKKQTLRRPTVKDNRPGGLISSGVIARANPVLAKDVIQETINLRTHIVLDGEYVRFFSQDDDMLKTIVSVVNNSPTCAAIIQQKVALIMGDGFSAMQGRPGSLFKSLSKQNQPITDPAQLQAIDDLLQVVNNDGQSIAEVMERVAMDFETFGNAYVSFARTGGSIFCSHEPFVKGRLKKRNDAGELSVVGFCDDWKNWQPTDARKNEVTLYPNWTTGADGIERTVIHIASYVPGFDYYGLSGWVSALFFATLEYMGGRWNQSKIENGYTPSGVLQFFGAVSEEEGNQIVADAKARIGLGNNGGLMIQVLSDDSLKAVFTPVQGQQNEGEFLALMQVSAQAIITAHRWTPSLAGVATAGQLGSNQSVLQEFQMAQNTVIRPTQNRLLNRFVNVFLKESQVENTYLEILNLTPVSFFGDIDLNIALTGDERRQELGYDPLPQKGGDAMAETRDTVNSFSPLLANKMIEKLKDDEVRGLLGFER